MGEWVDGWMDRQLSRWMEGWMDVYGWWGWMDRWKWMDGSVDEE